MLRYYTLLPGRRCALAALAVLGRQPGWCSWACGGYVDVATQGSFRDHKPAGVAQQRNKDAFHKTAQLLTALRLNVTAIS